MLFLHGLLPMERLVTSENVCELTRSWMRLFDAAADAGVDGTAMRSFLVRDNMGFKDWRTASARALDAAVHAAGA